MVILEIEIEHVAVAEHAGAKGLPQYHHPFELGERRIGAGQHEVFRPGLGRQQTIKRFSVRHGPLTAEVDCPEPAAAKP